MNTDFVLTNRKYYTREEAKETFGKYLSEDNLKILQDHICYKELHESIFSFGEDNGDLILNLGYGGDFIKVRKSK